MSLPKFKDAFESLTGYRPFPWQQRLYDEHLALGIDKLPHAIDIPTGLGKTAIMAIWLLARAAGASLPRRLVYIVDRRAVIDQATEFAEQLQRALAEEKQLAPVRHSLGLGNTELPISTLRGQHVDNRKWMANPAMPAIIVGTVDMVGSRLLFQGYGISRRMRPFAAGLLGCDALALLDEAHLSRPFEFLLKSIVEGRRSSGNESDTAIFSGPAAQNGFPPLFHVLPLSATLGPDVDEVPPDVDEVFRLNDDDKANEVVKKRLEACKSLEIKKLDKEAKLDEELSKYALQMMNNQSLDGKKLPCLVVYCNSRKDAEKVAAKLDKEAGKERTHHVIRFVGARRVHERQEAANELKEYGLVGNSQSERSKPVFVVATSAAEVGVDLDADHMVCDLVPWERMVQRLGRVNRRGKCEAQVLVLDQPVKEEKTGDNQGKDGEPESANDKNSCNKKESADVIKESVLALLKALPQDDRGGYQASPGALMKIAISSRCGQIEEATTPMPLYPALTRPLIDDWAMTSLDNHAGRPVVAPWLRGWVEDDPQTIVVWRYFLPLRFASDVNKVDVAPDRDVNDFFAAAPPQTSEFLETETSHVVEWFRKRTRKHLKNLDKKSQPLSASEKSGEDTIEGKGLLASLSQNSPVAFILDHSNQPVGILRLAQVDKMSSKELNAKLAGKRLVVDARLGGIDDGLLNDAAKDKNRALTIEDNWGKNASGNFKVELLTQDGKVSDYWQAVHEFPYCTSAEGEVIISRLIVKKRGEGQSEDARGVASKEQRLEEHQQWVEEEVARISDALCLGADDKAMLMAVARHHDDGKAADRWQKAFGARLEGGPYAKTKKAPNQRILSRFRHELKSVIDAEKKGFDTIDRSDMRFELALHLIAAHHGYARPNIGVEGYDDLAPSRAEAKVYAIAKRFASLQRKWGPWGLAWWETLLRSADQAVSRRLD